MMASLLAAGAAISVALVQGGPAYDAFPGSAVLPDGEVLVSFRRGAEHASPDGRLMVARREGDAGRWRISEVYDDPGADDRSHLGLTRLRGGRLLLPFYQREERDGEVTVRSFITTSEDRGRTWRPPRPVASGWLAAYGGVLEQRRRLLMPAYSRHEAVLMRSSDGGETWRRHSEIGPFSETSVVRIGEGNLLAVGRDSFASGNQYLYEARSRSRGRRWGPPRPLFPGVSPDLVELRDGHVLLCLADRLDSGAIQCRSRGTDGSWSPPASLWRSSGVDFGYPASTEVRAGRLVTFFYDGGDIRSVAYSSDLAADPAGK